MLHYAHYLLSKKLGLDFKCWKKMDLSLKKMLLQYFNMFLLPRFIYLVTLRAGKAASLFTAIKHDWFLLRDPINHIQSASRLTVSGRVHNLTEKQKAEKWKPIRTRAGNKRYIPLFCFYYQEFWLVPPFLLFAFPSRCKSALIWLEHNHWITYSLNPNIRANTKHGIQWDLQVVVNNIIAYYLSNYFSYVYCIQWMQ